MRTGVALGSNLGNRLENLRSARRRIIKLGGVQAPVLSSEIYETDPIGCEPEASKFLNAVVEFNYEGNPEQLLEQLFRIEESLGRKRNHAKNVSRSIDIDLLYCGDWRLDNKLLQLPHPRMQLRKFVLEPLADIRPKLILPGQTRTVRELLAEIKEAGDVVRFAHSW
jgi:2-amino-4-hydroxy-6-hydroxymethyldihydropteridine diphosphokinase